MNIWEKCKNIFSKEEPLLPEIPQSEIDQWAKDAEEDIDKFIQDHLGYSDYYGAAQGEYLNIRCMGVKGEVTIPDGVKVAYCSHNEITKLNLPEGIYHVECQLNQLTEIIIPESVERFYGRENPWDVDFIKWYKMKYNGTALERSITPQHPKYALREKDQYPCGIM